MTTKSVRYCLIAAFAAVLAMFAGVTQAQQAASDARPPRMNYTRHTLENGLEVVLLENHAVPAINLQVWYHVGSKDERPGRTGFAHLFEHLMFKGSAHVPAEEHSRIIEAVGGFDNAETGDDSTNFFETFPSNYLERVLWLEADRMGSLNVSEANFLSEREVVKEERRLRIENQPYGYIQEDLRAEARFLQHLLQAEQRNAGNRRRFRFRSGSRVDEKIFRRHSRLVQTDSTFE